jgi:periplasmic copper chaperone A
MKRPPALFIAIATSLVIAACGGTGQSSSLRFVGAWARSTPPGAVNGVVYFQVTSPIDDEIVSVEVPAQVAHGAQMHETMINGQSGKPMPGMNMGGGSGEMSMTPLTSLALPAKTTVTFEPGGKHIMLTDLTAPLKDGQTFIVTFHLRQAGAQPVKVTVAANAPS